MGRETALRLFRLGVIHWFLRMSLLVPARDMRLKSSSGGTQRVAESLFRLIPLPARCRLPAIACRNFSGARFVGFCRGFCKKWLFRRGYLMVSLWWSAGDLWCADGQFPGLKNMPQI